jgi:hypothetical protein
MAVIKGSAARSVYSSVIRSTSLNVLKLSAIVCESSASHASPPSGAFRSELAKESPEGACALGGLNPYSRIQTWNPLRPSVIRFLLWRSDSFSILDHRGRIHGAALAARALRRLLERRLPAATAALCILPGERRELS